MTYCSKKDLCYNYPLKCDSCISFSDCMNDTPLFQNKDLVEVVRCKNCKHFRDDVPKPFCRFFGDSCGITLSHFCSYGERKEE